MCDRNVILESPWRRNESIIWLSSHIISSPSAASIRMWLISHSCILTAQKAWHVYCVCVVCRFTESLSAYIQIIYSWCIIMWYIVCGWCSDALAFPVLNDLTFTHTTNLIRAASTYRLSWVIKRSLASVGVPPPPRCYNYSLGLLPYLTSGIKQY